MATPIVGVLSFLEVSNHSALAAIALKDPGIAEAVFLSPGSRSTVQYLLDTLKQCDRYERLVLAGNELTPVAHQSAVERIHEECAQVALGDRTTTEPSDQAFFGETLAELRERKLTGGEVLKCPGEPGTIQRMWDDPLRGRRVTDVEVSLRCPTGPFTASQLLIETLDDSSERLST